MLPKPGCGNTLATRYLSSRGELAPLLAHEIGHLWKFHDHEINRYIDHWNTHVYLAIGGIAGAFLVALAGYHKYCTNQQHPYHTESIITAIITGAAVIAGGMALLHAKIKQFSRRQELEADQFVAALGETELQQFITTLIRWHLNDELHAFLDSTSWLSRHLFKGGPDYYQYDIRTDMPYGIYAEGLYRAIERINKLGKPVYITENGIADKNNKNDNVRKTWIKRHFFAVKKAIDEGCDVRGFFYWSLLDNWEWDMRYGEAFGLYHVDFSKKSLPRTLRDGSRIYKNIAQGLRA